MKVMIFNDNFDSPTGYARQAHEFVKRFKEQNKDDELYYIGDLYGTLPGEIQVTDKNITFLPVFPPRGSNEYLVRIMSYIDMYKPDVFFIIGNGIVRVDLDKLNLIQFKKFAPDMKVVFYSFNEAEYLQTGERLIYNQCDLIIPSSKFSRFQLEREGLKCDEHVYPGVDENAFKPLKNKKELRKKFGYKEDDKIVFTYSRVSPRKNCRNMLSAAYSLPKYKFHLHYLELNQYVHYDMKDYIERICPMKHGKKNWDKHIKFSSDKVSDEELNEMINIADLVILPSFGEGFGFCLVETLMAGTPLMASNNSTIPELLSNEENNYAIQMKCNRYSEMSHNCYSKAPDDKLIAKYIESYFDPEKFEKNKEFWSLKAQEFREENTFSWDTWYNKLIGYIKREADKN